MTDRQKPHDAEDAEPEITDLGEGQRGVTSPSRGGTFRETPGEKGDKESGGGGPDAPIPHLQDE